MTACQPEGHLEPLSTCSQKMQKSVQNCGVETLFSSRRSPLTLLKTSAVSTEEQSRPQQAKMERAGHPLHLPRKKGRLMSSSCWTTVEQMFMPSPTEWSQTTSHVRLWSFSHGTTSSCDQARNQFHSNARTKTLANCALHLAVQEGHVGFFLRRKSTCKMEKKTKMPDLRLSWNLVKVEQSGASRTRKV